MKLTRGDKLPSTARAEVLAAFVYRWTTDNHMRAAAWRGLNPPTIPLVSDTEWLAAHAFYVTKAGHLARNRHRAEPAFLADASA